MSTAAMIYLCMSFMGLGMIASEHGKPRTPTNFWMTLIAQAICFSLLYWGGFFSAGCAS